MSKGSPIIPVRIPAELLAAVDAAIARTSLKRREGPWTRSAWILQALRDKLAHMERAARPKRSKKIKEDT